LNLLWQHAVRTEAYENVMDAIRPTLNQGDPQDPDIARKIVLNARKAAVRQMYTNNNYLISEVLNQAGVNHLPVLAHEPYGPNFLDESTYPELFTAATNAEGDNLVDIIKAIGTAVDLHTPDALQNERWLLVSSFISRMPLSATIKYAREPNSLSVNGQIVPNVLKPYNPELELKEWIVSPYAKTIIPFMLQDVIMPPSTRPRSEA